MLICSFCGKDESEVDTLVCGPAVYICDECIKLCAEILFDLKADRAATQAREAAFKEFYGTD